jgi:hypothetical protein
MRRIVAERLELFPSKRPLNARLGIEKRNRTIQKIHTLIGDWSTLAECWPCRPCAFRIKPVLSDFNQVIPVNLGDLLFRSATSPIE